MSDVENEDTNDNSTYTPVFSTPKGGLYGGPFDSSALDPNIRSVMMDYRWTTAYGGQEAATVITYAFAVSIDAYTDIPGGYPDTGSLATFVPLTEIQQAAVRTAFDLVSSYTNLTFTELDSSLAGDAAFRFAGYGKGGSESRFPANDGPYAPMDSRLSGDTFLGGNGNPRSWIYFGTDHLNTIMHEMGHAFGLKHGHDPSYNGTLAPEFNDNEFSVMTYASYFGADTTGATEAWVGSAPQSYMMYDIAALQAYYGANFSKVGTSAVYTWDPVTGQQFINGMAAPETGVSETGKIFTTVWTAGAETTYDLSAFGEDQVNDMRPGHWLTFSRAQLADLNNMAPEGTPEYQAQGNVYNALLYNGDWRSAVSNLITGSGNDTITGNDLDNYIAANAGNDHIAGGEGDDEISGGAGADTIVFGSGRSVLADTLADLNGDIISGLGFTSTVEIMGARIARAAFSITPGEAGAMFSTGGSSFQINGDFSNGGFMTVARGAGTDISTYVSFENLLPALSEKVSVDPSLINGVANTPFLSTDGEVSFTVELQQAVSGYHNMLGAYNISLDGTISDVRILYSDTLAAGTGETVNLGTPAYGQTVGFFLIQGGFDAYGALPDDLSFVAAGGGTSFDLEAGATPLLYSASRGLLSDAAVYHSIAAFNPGDLDQVLSGVSSDGASLRIGFEDLARASGDNDFQDVVIAVRETDGFLLA